jgi:hypothetical protein
MASHETSERLTGLRTEKPDLWNDLQTKSTGDQCPGDDEEVAEDLVPYDDEGMGDDDSEIPTHEVVQHVVTKRVRKGRQPKGKTAVAGLVSTGDAEDVNAEIVVEDEPGQSKRKRRPNTKYAAADFWRHANDQDEDLDELGS